MTITNEFDSSKPGRDQVKEQSEDNQSSRLFEDAYDLPHSKKQKVADATKAEPSAEPDSPVSKDGTTDTGTERTTNAGMERRGYAPPDGSADTQEQSAEAGEAGRAVGVIGRAAAEIGASIGAEVGSLRNGVTSEDRNIARLELAQEIHPLVDENDKKILKALQEGLVAGDVKLLTRAVKAIQGSSHTVDDFVTELNQEIPDGNPISLRSHDGSVVLLDGEHAVQVRGDGATVFRMDQKDNVVTLTDEDQKKLQPIYRDMTDKIVEHIAHPNRADGSSEEPKHKGEPTKPGDSPDEPKRPRQEPKDKNQESKDKNEESKDSDDLWGGRPWKEAIKAEGVEQSGVGDCFFMATLSGLANSDKGREKIHNMIREESDGSFTVTFPGAKDEPIKVTEKDLDNSKGNPLQDKWARVLETAFLEYTHDTPITGDLINIQGIPPLGRATTPRGVMKLLTGEDQATDQFELYSLGARQLLSVGATSKENVGRDLEEAMKNDRVVTSSASPSFAKFLLLNDSGALPDAHVYTVLDYDADKKMVTVRNPWASMGNGPLKEAGATADGVTHLGDGKLQMSLDTFYNRFSQMDISGKNPELHALTNVARSTRDSFGSVIDAGEDIYHLKPGDALHDLGKANKQSVEAVEEAVYAASSSTWHQLTENPERVLFPWGGPAVDAPRDIVTGVLRNPGDAPGIIKDVAIETAKKTVTAPIMAPINAGKGAIKVIGGLLG